ncbi:MAG TPA: hypothetical protein VGS16_06915 [Candidatus Dormibacteraeota bacterium]|nr:hypothetical protein [Candidatus Dormibacteraeota bacterium]
MYPYMNEDVMFERLKDLQREAENSRLMAGSLPSLLSLARNLATRAWLLGGLAMRRAPRPRPVEVRRARHETAPRDAA